MQATECEKKAPALRRFAAKSLNRNPVANWDRQQPRQAGNLFIV